jgi:hypothetical protein
VHHLDASRRERATILPATLERAGVCAGDLGRPQFRDQDISELGHEMTANDFAVVFMASWRHARALVRQPVLEVGRDRHLDRVYGGTALKLGYQPGAFVLRTTLGAGRYRSHHSYMGKADSHKNSEVRGVLEPVSKMAERSGAAVLSITHFSKAGASNGAKALHRFIGSIAFTAAARFAFAVMADPEDENRRLFLHVKNNLAAPPQGLAFRLGQRIVGDPDKSIIGSYVMWDSEPVTITANEALAADANGGDRSASAEAEDFLRDKLSAGPVPAKEGEDDAHALGITRRTLMRARKKLGVVAEKSGLKEGWIWRLPEECQTPPNGARAKSLALFGEVSHSSAFPDPKGGQELPKSAKKDIWHSSASVGPLREGAPLVRSAPALNGCATKIASDFPDIPDFLLRSPVANQPAITAGPDDSLDDFR